LSEALKLRAGPLGPFVYATVSDNEVDRRRPGVVVKLTAETLTASRQSETDRGTCLRISASVHGLSPVYRRPRSTSIHPWSAVCLFVRLSDR